MGKRLPDRHPNKDFFILDVTDASPRDDMASMEHPVFSLSIKPDRRELSYEHDGKRIVIVPSGKGLATIMDKDIILYCISKLVRQINAGEAVSQWVELSAHEVMVAANWNTGARDYARFRDALFRLRGTTVYTDVPTGNVVEGDGFGLIDAFKTTRLNENGEDTPFGRMTKVRIKLSDWTFRAVQSMEVLSIDKEYFRLRRPLERRLYELARKHVGEQGRPFRIGMVKLQKKVGSNSPAKKFRFFLREIIEDGHIPQYDLAIDGGNVVMSQKKAPTQRRQGELAIGPSLTVKADTMDKARRAAPGYDIYVLYEEWKAFAKDRGTMPDRPDAAFIGFCKARHKRAPLT